jgi:dTDP-glucose 4,6-dehydratase
MRVVVLGAAGFLGSHLCDRLISGGNSVVGVDDLSTGSISNLEKVLEDRKFSFTSHNICEKIEIDGSVDVVLNFASPASPKHYQKMPIHTLKTGSLGTNNAIDFALSKQARFVMASTSEVYGEPMVHPQTEKYWGNVNPVGDRSCYDEAKRFSEALCMTYKNSRDLNLGIVRIFNTYGPRLDPGDGRVVSNFIYHALRNDPLTIFGDGSQTRSFCFVDDLIDVILKITNSTFTGPVNIGNQTEITIRSLAKTVIEIVDSKSMIKYAKLPNDDPTQRCPDLSLAMHEFHWLPTISLSEGLRATVSWMRSIV